MARLGASILKTIINSVARSKLSVVGAVLFVLLLPVLTISIILDLQGIIENPYFGFLIYLVIGPLFGLGIIFMFIGALYSRGREDIGIFAYEYIREQIARPGRFSRIRKLFYLASGISILAIIVVSLVTYTGFHYTESTSFCGQFCHQVMTPEYITYNNSPHSRVPCVQCHIGKSAELMTKAKISGIKQLVAVALDSYHRPILTPISSLRPERETCEQCHRPEMFHGDRLYIKDKFLPDEKNSHVQTVLLMKVGSAGYNGREAHGIHWHVSENHRVSYLYTDDAQEKILKVTLEEPDSSRKVYVSNKEDARWSEDLTENSPPRERIVDCMDCHNRPTHIFLAPDEALDQKILTKTISQDLPFIKRQALAAITKPYETSEKARLGIAREIRSWYESNYPEIATEKAPLLEKAIAGIQQAYSENVFPEMNIQWGTYKNFIGHEEGSGCFRCHDGSHESRDGAVIVNECEACHVILAIDQPSPDIVKLLRSSGHQTDRSERPKENPIP